jgi:hypothetical protein
MPEATNFTTATARFPARAPTSEIVEFFAIDR